MRIIPRLSRAKAVSPFLAVSIIAGLLPIFVKPFVAVGIGAGLFLTLIIVRRPRIGLVMVALAIPMETAGVLGNLIGNLPLTVAKIFTVLTLASWLINLAMGKLRYRRVPLLYLLLAFWGITAISLMGAAEFKTGVEAVFRLATTIIFFFLIVQLVDSPKILKWCLLALVLATTATGAYSIIQRYMPQSTFEFRTAWEEEGSLRSGVERDPIERRMVGVVERSSGVSLHSVILALNVCLVVAPLGAFLSNINRRDLIRMLFWIGSLAILFAAVVVTYARTGMVLLLLALILMLWHRLIRITVGKMIVFVLAIIVLFAAAPKKYTERVLNPANYSQKRSVSIRTRGIVFRHAMAQFIDHPVLGVGYGNMYGIFDYYTTWPDKKSKITPHNAYLQVAMQVGLPGLIILLVFFWKVHVHTRRSVARFKARDRPDLVRLGNALNISMLVFLFSGLAADLFDKGMPNAWLITGLCAAYTCLAREQIAAEETDNSVSAEPAPA